MSYLVDSDVLVDGLVGIPAALDLFARLRHEGLAVSIVSYGEVFEGAFKASDPRARLARFGRTLTTSLWFRSPIPSWKYSRAAVLTCAVLAT